MTNMTTASVNAGWEVAGGKKNAIIKKIANEPAAKGNKAKEALKIPKIDTLQPIKLEAGVYDALRESDDDDIDLDELNNNKSSKSKSAQSKSKQQSNGDVSTVKNGTVPRSPKSVESKKQTDSSAEPPLNLLASSMAATQKKKPTATKQSPENELDTAIGQLKLEDLEKELANLNALFPGKYLTINEQLAAYMNRQFKDIGEFEPSSGHENENSNLISKLDKRVVKLFNSVLSKLNKTEAEALFENLFENLFMESNKNTHGLKLYIQLLIKQSSSMSSNFALTNLTKYNDVFNTNKHKHQRCLIALWSLAQVGYSNLSNGIKIWFECMLPLVNTKGSTVYIATYLNSLLNYHKIDKESTPVNSGEHYLVTIDQYSRLFDLKSDKSLNLQKDQAQKLTQSFEITRAQLLKQMTNMNRNSVDYFQLMLSDVPLESGTKQTDLLDLIATMFNRNRELILEWRKIYAKHIAQSLLLLEYLAKNESKSFKRIKQLGETLRFFDENSSNIINKLQSGGHAGGHHPGSSAKNYYARIKANKQANGGGNSELGMFIKFNKQVKQVINDHFRKSTSAFTMAFRSILIIALLIGAFFYWDINTNKSVYTIKIEKELEKYGLLEPTLKLLNSVKNLLITIKNQVNFYIPLWYKKFNQNVVPVVLDGWKIGKEYASIYWTKTQPLRDSASVYWNQTIDFVYTNYPAVVKNLISVFQLAINYVTTLVNFAAHYLSQFADFIGVQLLGFKKGDMEKIFFDAIKVSIEYLAQLFQKLSNYLNQS